MSIYDYLKKKLYHHIVYQRQCIKFVIMIVNDY